MRFACSLKKMRPNPVHIGPAAAPGKRADPAKKDARPPLHIVGVGNKLIFTSEDPEAIEVAVSLYRLLINTEPGRDFEAIRLKNAKATSVAKVIEEAFNGKSVERVRVVADAETNTLLLRASTLDAITIRSLIAKELDISVDAGAPRKGK